jgi:hypothetical protein
LTGIAVNSTKAEIETAMLIIANSMVHICKERYDSESSFKKKQQADKAMVAAKRTDVLVTACPVLRSIG